MRVSRTICLGFFTVITIGAVLLMLPLSTASGTWNDPITAIFTATSAVCVTGHIVVDTATYFSTFGQLIILLLIQIGGLGYMVATTLLLILLGRRQLGLRDRLAIQQAMDRPKLQGTVPLLRSIIATILIFEMTGMFFLMTVFIPEMGFYPGLWFSIFHSISAWNNAGFSLFSDSLVGFQSSVRVNLVISLLVILGGIGYETIFEVMQWIQHQFKKNAPPMSFSLNFRVATSTTVFLLLIGTVAFLFTERNNPNTLAGSSFDTKLLMAWFQSMTARTAGFNSIDVGQMTTAGLFFTIFLMFIGGSPGGTAGGIKTTTLRVISSCTQTILQGKEEVVLYERKVPTSMILKALGVVFGSLTTVIIATMLIALTDPKVNFINVLFEVVSAFATVGLSTGITASLSGLGKLVLVVTMYMGRVGILLLMSALIGESRASLVHYPEESLLVG
ncbi:TrkH family potassium uptake protein [Lyngbya confervoides]|uniref:TrkH family potassium uptake protein n=1 Tax=Lyngbya confervoides BDU141951 TaxID=1574623 RepID=A0ABD4TAJ6_9CYAN|nr:TrkH family potassium uptake protein [Lyngbya confervoides]MCM1985220.1 TrkH family potassium uptake protein [Lyngbya confervoides BDU141951]